MFLPEILLNKTNKVVQLKSKNYENDTKINLLFWIVIQR